MARPLAVDLIAVIQKIVNTTLNTTIKAKILKQRRHRADCGRRAVGSRKWKIREPNITIAATGNVSASKGDPRREIAAVKQAHHQVFVAHCENKQTHFRLCDWHFILIFHFRRGL